MTWWFSRKSLIYLISTLCFGLLTQYALGAEVAKEKEIPEVVVTAPKIIKPTRETGESVYTGYEVTKDGLEFVGERGLLNAWQAMELLPGVFFESADAHNLASEQAGFRVRGTRGMLGSLTVLGVPNYGGAPIGPRSYIYDLENFESLALYKGAIPVSLATGVGTRGGLIELRPRWPKDNVTAEVKVTTGSFDFIRGYIRVDTGRLPDIQGKMSFAYSYAKSDKWKGPGDLGPRHNLHIQYVQPLGSNLEARFLFNHNDIKLNRYYYLTYNETKNLSQNRRLDFHSDPTLRPYHRYYDYNRAKHLNQDFIGILNFKPSPKVSLSLKGYYQDEDAKVWEGSPNVQGSEGIQKRIRDIEKKGIIPEAILSLGQITITLGFHYEKMLMKISTENYNFNGSQPVYRGLGVVASASPTYTFSPYLQIAGTFDRISMQAGLKYFHMKEEKSEGYFWNATIRDLQRAPDLDRKEKRYEIWLPSFGLSYSLNPQTEIYLSYGKTFIRPYNYLPLVSTYHRLRGNFTQAGITLADLFEGFDIERADVFDLGLRIKGKGFDLNPTIFYSYHKKLLTNVSDPRVRDGGRPVSYRQNVGEARGLGLEVITNVYLTDNLFFFFNPTYQKVTYTKDISYQGVTYNTKGRQIVDVPRTMLVGGMTYRFQNFFITPKIKYMGKRYGTITHEEKVSSYTTVDLSLGYQRKSIYSLQNLKLSLEFNNLFDKKYISHISAFDDDVSGVRYAVGSPFTVRGGLSFEF